MRRARMSNETAASPTPRTRTPIHFHIRDLVLLGAVALFAHGLLLLNDGIYWDDWLLYPQLQRHDWPAIDALVHEAGTTPINSAFLHVFAYSPGGVFSFKLTVFLLIVAGACLIYLIGLEAGLGRLTAWCVAALQMVFPGFQDWVLLATAASVFDFVLFLLATFLLLRAERASPRSRLALRVAAATGFVPSFGFNSLLALYFGSLLLLLLILLRSASLRDLLRAQWLYASALVVLPIVYWEVSQRLFVPSGLYGGYNSISTKPSVILSSFARFVKNGILLQMLQSLTVFLNPWTWLMLAAFIAILFIARRRISQPANPEPKLAIAGAALGLVLLGLAMLPYSVVGKYPAVHGWDTRHDLLVGLPLAVLLVSFVSAAFPAGRRAWAGLGLLGFFAIGFSGAGIQDYAALQARWATDRAVTAELQSDGSAGRFSVYWVHDGAPGPEDFYRAYEWSVMLGSVYGDQDRVGLDVRAYDSRFLEQTQFFSDRYNLANFDPHGCQADLTIARATGAGTSEDTALIYSFYSLVEPDRLEGYVRSLVTIQVMPKSSPDATHCSP
jgi:hypothetical protein